MEPSRFCLQPEIIGIPRGGDAILLGCSEGLACASSEDALVSSLSSDPPKRDAKENVARGFAVLILACACLARDALAFCFSASFFLTSAWAAACCRFFSASIRACSATTRLDSAASAAFAFASSALRRFSSKASRLASAAPAAFAFCSSKATRFASAAAAALASFSRSAARFASLAAAACRCFSS